jgi:hypothetical protein
LTQSEVETVPPGTEDESSTESEGA